MKSYIISVSLCTGCYRHIQISAEATLYQLHKAIISAFEFEDNQPHAFFMDNVLRASFDTYWSGKADSGGKVTKNNKLADLHLQKGNKFKYVFGLGASWEFQCKTLREVEEQTDIPHIIRSVGEPPEQYPQTEALVVNNESEFDEDGFPVVYPQKVCDAMYDRIPLPRETIALLRDYTQAASNFYARLPLRDLFRLYNRQNEKITQENFLAVMEVLRHEEHGYYAILGQESLFEDAEVSEPIDREILTQYLWSIDDYCELAEMQQGKPMKILPKEEFLRYTDDDYQENTPQRAALYQYLKQKPSRRVNDPKDILFDLSLGLIMDDDIPYLMEEAQYLGISFDSRQDINEFLRLLQDANNHTRKHSNRGFTPAELSTLRPEAKTKRIIHGPLGPLVIPQIPETAPALKISSPPRNKPCPCGSGRKYKHCCGKNT